MELKRRKKGMYHSMDALLAGMLLLGVAVFLLQTPFYESAVEQKSFIAEDVLSVLSEMKVSELNSTFIDVEIANGNITNTQNSILEQMGEYWALNNTAKATALFEVVFNQSLPNTTASIEIVIETDPIFVNNISSPNDIVTGRRMISGIAKGAPLTGFSSSAYLKKVRNKKNIAFAYFGGFFGQGNITSSLQLPADFDASRFILADLKIETPGDFKLYINGAQCGGVYSGNQYQVSSWDISSCDAYFVNGTNKILFNFVSGLNESYISGGFLKVEYTTDTLNEQMSSGYKRYYLPEISGFINIYDAISAQGLITNWTLNVSFYNEYNTFFTFGNDTIFVASGKNTTQNVVYTLTNQTIAPTQIPIRMGVTNFSNITIVDAGDPADVFLVTDVSGSMDDCGLTSQVNQTMCGYEWQFWFWWFGTQCPYTGSCVADECGTGASSTRNHNVFNQTSTVCDATLLDIAKDADKLFVDNVLNGTLHQIGLVHFSTDSYLSSALSSDTTVLKNQIDNYNANGATCTCCGINRAKDQLLASSDNRFMIVLSDGEPTRKCSSFSDYTGESGTTVENTQWAIDAGQQACNNNITVYTIGFGSGMTAAGHDTMRQIACNDSLYYNATNVGDLAAIYENISNQVLVAANYSSQTVNVVGNFSASKIFADSYIDLYYDPITPPDELGRISLTFESDPFSSCMQTVEIPDNIAVEDAFVTSFSSIHWTKSVKANGVVVFNISDYGSDYTLLGDPFVIQIPSPLLNPGQNNTFELEIGDSPTNSTACSLNNSLIYTALINASTPRTQTVEIADGCTWTIQSETDTYTVLPVPSDYSGPNICVYNATAVIYNPLDAYDVAVFGLLEELDPDNNGKLLVDLTSSDLEITITVVSGIPYLWGPSLVSLNVWN
ncbi:MAG: VWA domain-containing protein [Nanoarchaeota archaeon]|nr:VWA domain-containing protein [Nanoarchaeota archaeon]